MSREHMDALNRKNTIEKRKEEAERREQEKVREEARYNIPVRPKRESVALGTLGMREVGAHEGVTQGCR